MKTAPLLLILAVAAACSRTGEGTVPATDASNAPAASTQQAAASNSATGVIEVVDPTGSTVTIAHGPVDALKWPAMTMKFKTANVDVSSIKPGDRVSFEFTSTGMNGTITRIKRQ